MTSILRALAAGLTLLSAVVACDALPPAVKDQGRAHRLSDLGIERFGSTGAYRLAGVSATRTIEVQPLKRGELEGDTLGAGYHAFRMRCQACHELPSPSAHPASLWEGIVGRMRTNALNAGLMPMTQDEEAKVVSFLQKHAGSGP
jgi:mono/diheme cytochrome c family protein